MQNDQCQHCTCRGDTAECDATPCQIRQAWRYRELEAENARFFASHAENAIFRNENIILIAENAKLREMLDLSLIWLKAAIECKSWIWDADQHEAAKSTLKEAREALGK